MQCDKNIKKEDAPKHDFRFSLPLTTCINEDFLVRVVDQDSGQPKVYIILINLYFKVVQFFFDYIRYGNVHIYLENLKNTLKALLQFYDVLCTYRYLFGQVLG
jgi:hypothetical protein